MGVMRARGVGGRVFGRVHDLLVVARSKFGRTLGVIWALFGDVIWPNNVRYSAEVWTLFGRYSPEFIRRNVFHFQNSPNNGRSLAPKTRDSGAVRPNNGQTSFMVPSIWTLHVRSLGTIRTGFAV